MKTYISTIIALAICAGTTQGIAQSKQSKKKTVTQSEESIIIRKGDGKNTTVEIKDGEVYINGDKVSQTETDGKGTKKIIIENGAGGERMNFFDEEFENDIPRKAMLGIYTKINENQDGAEIERVMPNTAADKAGLRTGDVITKIDGKPIKDGKALTEMIAKRDAGDKVNVTYERNGKTLNTDASLSAAKQDITAKVYQYGPQFREMEIPNVMGRPFAFDISNEAFDSSPKMGVTVEELADGNGVRVLNIKPESAAAQAGIQKDDVIKSLDGETILSLDDLQTTLHGVKRNENLKLKLERNGKPMNTTIQFPKATRKKDL